MEVVASPGFRSLRVPMAARERGALGTDIRDRSREPAVSGTVTVGDRLLVRRLLDALDGLHAPHSGRSRWVELWPFAAQLHGKEQHGKVTEPALAPGATVTLRTRQPRWS